MPWWMIGGSGSILVKALQTFGTDIIKNIGWEIAVESIGGLSMVVEVVVVEEGGDGEEDEDEEIVAEIIIQIIVRRIN